MLAKPLIFSIQVWNSWSIFGDCTVTCGGGTKTRSRECLHGPGCPGDYLDIMDCSTSPCPGDLNPKTFLSTSQSWMRTWHVTSITLHSMGWMESIWCMYSDMWRRNNDERKRLFTWSWLCWPKSGNIIMWISPVSRYALSFIEIVEKREDHWSFSVEPLGWLWWLLCDMWRRFTV